jgi:hypothetical protein
MALGTIGALDVYAFVELGRLFGVEFLMGDVTGDCVADLPPFRIPEVAALRSP